MDATALVDSALEEARAPLAPRVDSLTVTDLLDLWHGDGLSTGYHHPYLILGVCRLCKPPSLRLLCTEYLFPALEYEQVPPRTLSRVLLGYRLWRKEVEAE